MINPEPKTPATVIDLTHRVVRFQELIPCKTAFIDAKTPGSDQKENFCIIGAGVAENPDQITHIQIPHGFDIGAAKQPRGCKNSHHSHDTEEVFFVHRGRWKFTWGEHGTDGHVVLGQGDMISLPLHLFRGFENVGDDEGFLLSVLGLNQDGTAGQVVWAPHVIEQARHHGLILWEDGRLIDTTRGGQIPLQGRPMQPLKPEALARFKRLTLDDMLKGVCFCSQLSAEAYQGGLNAVAGVTENVMIGIADNQEGLPAGRINWPHGFSVRHLRLVPGASTHWHQRFEEEVILVHQGSIQVETTHQVLTLAVGDVLTCPIELARNYLNISRSDAELLIVRRTDTPRPAHFL